MSLGRVQAGGVEFRTLQSEIQIFLVPFGLLGPCLS